MYHHILADYYEEKGFINKSLRLRKRNSLILFGHYNQYNAGVKYTHDYYNHNFIYSNGCGFNYSIIIRNRMLIRECIFYGYGDGFDSGYEKC